MTYGAFLQVDDDAARLAQQPTTVLPDGYGRFPSIMIPEPARRLGQASLGDSGQPDSRRSKMAFSAARGSGSVPASPGISRT